ncbi:MAG: DedA family protein [Acetobacteraceae bacterium]|nr:DedA family protein [Acetobacteraceae bacterium]
MICSWIHAIVGLVGQNPGWALTVAFAGAIIEAVAVVGILIPGTPLLMAVTAAAAVAGQPMVPFLVVAIIGAVIGDFLSFWAGQRYSNRLRHCWPFSRQPKLMAQADGFFLRYGVASVALCRFIPVLRSTVPLVAGMTGMSRRRFVLANVTSAFVWAPVHVFPAQFAGLSIERLQDGDWQSASLWGAALVCSCAAGWALHRRVLARAR